MNIKMKTMSKKKLFTKVNKNRWSSLPPAFVDIALNK